MKRTLFLITAAAGLAACVTPGGPAPLPAKGPEAPPQAYRRLPPEEWPLIQDDLPAAPLAKAAERAVAYLKTLDPGKTLQVGDRSAAPQLLIETAQELARLRAESSSAQELTAKLKAGFDLYRISGATQPGGAFFSSYYQPVLKASLTRTERFQYPLYKRPPDMVEADLGAFNPKFKGESVVGRMDGRRLVPYFDRRDIDVRKALEGKGLELAWLETQFDRLDLHIEGSGLLELPEGSLKMARFAATNALPYKSVGLSVVGSGAMTREQITHETLRQYLADHPEGESWLLSQNPRYTFFELVDVPADGEPNGSTGQPLTSGRSIAVDAKATPLGAAVLLKLDMAQTDEQGRLLGKAPGSRLAFCQDEGGAIKGPGRVDIYVGHGPQAAGVASKVWDAGELYLLLKKLPPRQR